MDIVAVIVVILLIQVALEVYRRRRADGRMYVSETDDGGLLYSLELDSNIETLGDKGRVVFRVVDKPEK